jgi:acyl dehydratase
MSINYGLNKVRFPAPVPVGSRLRATFEAGRRLKRRPSASGEIPEGDHK